MTGGAYNLDISDSGGSDSPGVNSGGKMYVSTVKAFVLAFLAILLAVGVGIIVHFAGSRSLTCNCQCAAGGTGSSNALLSQCRHAANTAATDTCEYMVCF